MVHIPAQTSEGGLKWPFAVTRLTAIGRVSDLVVCKL